MVAMWLLTGSCFWDSFLGFAAAWIGVMVLFRWIDRRADGPR